MTAQVVVVLGFLVLATSPVLAQQIPGPYQKDPLFDVALAGPRAVVVGFPGLIWESDDAGRTFRSIGPGGPFGILAVTLVGGEPWASGRDGRVLRRDPETGRWVAAPTGTREHLLDLDFVDGQRGMAVGNFATAIRTDDGGASWESVSIAPEGEDPAWNGVAFLDRETVVVVGEFGWIARSEDGGRSFQRQDSADAQVSLFGVTAVDGGILAVGQEGTVLWGPGGRDFQAVEVPTREHLVRVAAAGSRVVAVGLGGTVIRADHPAGPWERVPVPVFGWLGGVALSPDGVGLLVGAEGALLRSEDFGRTWVRGGGER